MFGSQNDKFQNHRSSLWRRKSERCSPNMDKVAIYISRVTWTIYTNFRSSFLGDIK